MKKNRAIVVLLLTAIITVFLCYTAGVGIGPTGTGSAKNIKTGLDLSGGVSITYQGGLANWRGSPLRTARPMRRGITTGL